MSKYKTRICQNCQKAFLAGNRYKSVNCPACEDKIAKEQKVSYCLNCKGAFAPVHSNQRFCSIECRHQYKERNGGLLLRYKKRCANTRCNKEFLGDKRQRYCCKNCYEETRIDKSLARPIGPDDYVTMEPVRLTKYVR